MALTKHSMVIKCTVDKAFDYVADWQNLKSFTSNILDINPVSYVQSGPGAAFDTTFKVGGANILTTLEVLEFVRDKRIMLRSRHNLKIVAGWEFKQVKDGTNVSFSMQYEIPAGFVRSDRDRSSMEKEFDDAATQSLQLLKWVLASSTSQDSIG